MSYGVLQDYFTKRWPLHGSSSGSGVIGTTFNGVIYLSMPFLFALFSRPQRARFRRVVAVCGMLCCCVGFLLSSFGSHLWHVIAAQGILAALGSALMYSPMTLSLGECFSGGNRAVAYGIVFSSKNIVGSTCPFLLQVLLDRYGYKLAMQIWTGIVAVSSLGAILLTPVPVNNDPPSDNHRPRRGAWQFLKHSTIYIYSIATMLQSSGYGLPQTYLVNYARTALSLSETSATLLLTLFNIPGILSCSFFGYLIDNKRYPLSATTTMVISSVCSALSVFLLWGLALGGNMAPIILFSIVFGFFAGGYSSIWGGVINEMEVEAARRNEPVDPGLLLGLLNGARGIGYVSGGLVGIPLINSGGIPDSFAGYATEYGPLITFTGISTALGGWSIVWKCRSAHLTPFRRR